MQENASSHSKRLRTLHFDSQLVLQRTCFLMPSIPAKVSIPLAIIYQYHSQFPALPRLDPKFEDSILKLNSNFPFNFAWCSPCGLVLNLGLVTGVNILQSDALFLVASLQLKRQGLFNIFQSSVAFCIETSHLMVDFNTKWLVSIRNATLGWDELLSHSFTKQWFTQLSSNLPNKPSYTLYKLDPK